MKGKHSSVASSMQAQRPALAAVCRLLGDEIDAALPMSAATIAMDAPAYIEAEKKGDYEHAMHLGINAEIALIGAITGPVGWGISGAYLLIDSTIGWDNVLSNMSDMHIPYMPSVPGNNDP